MPPAGAAFVAKLKVQLKLAIARLRMVQKRDEALAKTQRRAMAQLLDVGKEDSARIRVENIIRSDITTELHEILELYCELLLARAGLLEAPTCDPGLEEAVKSIIYAAPKTEIKELHQVRTLLAEKFGKEFALQAVENSDGKVSEKVVKKLSVTPPREELVVGYLEEIAKVYGVNWPKKKADLGDPPDFMDDDENPSGGQAQKNFEALLKAEDKEEIERMYKCGWNGCEKAYGTLNHLNAHVTMYSHGTKRTPEEFKEIRKAEAQEELSKATPPVSFGPASPLHVNPPPPSTDNIHPKVTLNHQQLQPKQPPASGGVVKKAPAKGSIADGIPDVDELAKRFAALKK